MATNLLNYRLACCAHAVWHSCSRFFLALPLMLFSVAAFSAVEQVPPSSPAQSIPAQTGIEAVSPSSSDWIAYYGGYSYGGYHSSAAIACAAFNDGSTGYPSSYTKFVFAGTTANLYIGFPYLDCLSTTVIISALPPSIPPPSSTPIRNGSVKLIFVCPVPVINPVVPYTYNQSTSLCERAAANLCPSATPPYTRNSTTNRCERPAVCPAPATYPEIPYIYNPTNRMCERTVPDKLTITLSGGSTTEPSTSLPFKAIVTDQAGQPADAQVTLKVDVAAYTGGHEHDADRPKGKLSSANGGTTGGVLNFDFIAEEVSGTHTITAICDKCRNTATASIDVKVAGLEEIPGSELYALQDADGSVIGAVPRKHTANHYLTPEAAGKLAELADAYDTITLSESLLYLNDASLEWGGLFDVGSRPWKTPHAGHRRGVVIDIRASTTPGSIPFWLFDGFEKAAKGTGIKAALHCLDNGTLVIGHYCYEVLNSRHYHVQLLGVDK